jgi:adenine specific DNA methylase Mod
MLYPRLKLLRRLLDDTGSIFVHCDYHVEHGIKLLMDEIFGQDNFRNQSFVSRIRKNIQERELSKKLNVALDTILFYAKSGATRIQIYYSDSQGEAKVTKGDANLSTILGVDYPIRMNQYIGKGKF